MDYGCRMLDTKFIDELARQISDSIPAGVKGVQQDLQKNIHTLLQGALAKLDLVTREEFDTQTQVLLRTREKLEQLEKTIAELEEKKS
jgi:BMFP domain-containing protein YqiC